MERMDDLNKVLSRWGREGKRLRKDLRILGSPDRAMGREVLEDARGELLVVERLPLPLREGREKQAMTLQGLAAAGLSPLLPWLSPSPGSYGVVEGGYFWQLRPWGQGVPLPRDSYAQDGWRGAAAARFLLAMRAAAEKRPDLPGNGGRVFSLGHYIGHLMEHFQRMMPALVTDLTPMLQELKEYFHYEENVTPRFCHGDFHPGNILWGDQEIRAVIDWEFCGRKPAAYDMANLLGCLGMDDPAFLTGPMALDFLKCLQDADFLAPQDLHFLPDMMAALRFAWMREWVARKDLPMITQELDFLWLVLDNRELLRKKWTLR
ncbi:MAG: phosphotransferase enzyme family protein [Oligosphaeraceae bacterium]